MNTLCRCERRHIESNNTRRRHLALTFDVFNWLQTICAQRGLTLRCISSLFQMHPFLTHTSIPQLPLHLRLIAAVCRAPTLFPRLLSLHRRDQVDQETEDVARENERDGPFEDSSCVGKFNLSFPGATDGKNDDEDEFECDEGDFDPKGDLEDTMAAEICERIVNQIKRDVEAEKLRIGGDVRTPSLWYSQQMNTAEVIYPIMNNMREAL